MLPIQDPWFHHILTDQAMSYLVISPVHSQQDGALTSLKVKCLLKWEIHLTCCSPREELILFSFSQSILRWQMEFMKYHSQFPVVVIIIPAPIMVQSVMMCHLQNSV